MRLVLLSWVLFFCSPLAAQISGTVTDSKTNQPVEGAEVFVNKTLLKTTTGVLGAFSLKGINPGFSELIIYKKGYAVFKSPIRTQEGKAFKLFLNIVPLEVPDQPIVESGALHDAHLKIFASKLLGNGNFAPSSNIINPDQINFREKSDRLRVSAVDPVIVENQKLGYRISYYLLSGELDVAQVFSQPIFRFDTLKASSDNEKREWIQNRDQIFFSSSRHFFLSLLAHRLRKEGFSIADENGKKIFGDSLISSRGAAGYSVIKLQNRLTIRYNSGRPGVLPMVSTLYSADEAAVNPEGILLNDKLVEVSGAMKTSGLADLMPLNFEPTTGFAKENPNTRLYRLLQEKIYLQTDKPYYYPGEALWFSGYVNYYSQAMRDSLSKVMYVELINPDKKIILTRILKIDSGFTRGDMILPDSMKKGNYQLRAYTNLMRNFSTENFFDKTIPILNPTDKVDPQSAISDVPCSAGLSVLTDKKKYHLRDKITLTFTMMDKKNSPIISRLSVSVTDALQVVPVDDTQNILSLFPIDPESVEIMPESLNCPSESGIGFTGQYLTVKGKKEKTVISVAQGGFENLHVIPTNDQGIFYENNYDFYDTMKFAFQPQATKGKTAGTIKIASRDIPAVASIDTTIRLKVNPTNKKQRIISDYEVPRGIKVLATAEIIGKRTQVSEFVRGRYGLSAVRRFPSDRFKSLDLLSDLIGIIPGLKKVYVPSIIPGDVTTIPMLAFAYSNNSLYSARGTTPREPLIYVDGTYRGGGMLGFGPTAISALLNINARTIDYVEVISNTNPMISSEGGTGLIAIFLKPGEGMKYFTSAFIPGFTKPRIFNAPEYDVLGANAPERDFRATIFWDYSLKIPASTGKTSVSFFAADLPGKYHVVVEGVTSDAKPIRCEYSFEVVDQ